MNNQEIKNEAEKLYAQIKNSQEKLNILRKDCIHEKSYEGNYSYRVGVIQLADICVYCGEVMRIK